MEEIDTAAAPTRGGGVLVKPLIIVALVLVVVATSKSRALAWGDEGHEIVGRIADHYLKPDVRTKVKQLLDTDATRLVPDHTIATEATWADKFRDSDRNTTKVHYNQTHNWHFVDLDVDHPDVDVACFHHPALPAGTPASIGPPDDCVIDKIDEFAAELKDSTSSADEKREALQFLLHFVGDLHQPLHASTQNNDHGGNLKNVSAKGLKAGKLHHFWDTEFVAKLGTNPTIVANSLVSNITDTDVAQWTKGNPSDWAQESLKLSQEHAYGLLPAPTARGSYRLPTSYVQDATRVVATQLSKAGVRLAFILNDALATSPSPN